MHLIIGLSYFNPVDFTLQFETAKKIAQGQILYRDISEIHIDGRTIQGPKYPPLYLYSLGFLIAIIGVNTFSWQMAKVFLIGINLFVGILIYYIVLSNIPLHPKNQIIALGALNWFLLNPSTLGVIFGGYHENFMLFFVLLGFILLKSTQYPLSGLCFGLALLVKPTAGIYMLPLIAWGINTRNKKSFLIWIAAFFTFLLGSLPFLLIAPTEYLNDVFLFHTQRPDPNMSFYTYFPREISASLVPFIIQLIILGFYTFLYTKKYPIANFKDIIVATLPFMTVFMIFNRILYPHYVAFFFPFLTLTLFTVIIDLLDSNELKIDNFCLLGLISGLLLVYLGAGSWSIIWILQRYENFSKNPLFLVSAITFLIGLILISVSATFYSNYSNKKRLETEN